MDRETLDKAVDLNYKINQLNKIKKLIGQGNCSISIGYDHNSAIGSGTIPREFNNMFEILVNNIIDEVNSEIEDL